MSAYIAVKWTKIALS